MVYLGVNLGFSSVSRTFPSLQSSVGHDRFRGYTTRVQGRLNPSCGKDYGKRTAGGNIEQKTYIMQYTRPSVARLVRQTYAPRGV